MDGNDEARTNGEVPPEGDISRGPANPNDGQVGGRGAAQAKEQEDVGEKKREAVTEKATNTTAEKDTVGHPDSTEGSNSAGLDSEPILEENLTLKPTLGQWDNRTITPGEYSEGGTKGEAPPEGDNSLGPANQNDDHGDGTGAAQAKEQEDGGQKNREPVTEKATTTTAEKDTVGHPDSTEGSNSAGLGSEPILEENLTLNPALGQGDNRTITPGECSEGGTKGEAPPEGDNSLGPANQNDDHGDGTGAAQAKAQEDGGQKKREPVTEKPTNTTAEKEEPRDDSDPIRPDNDDPRTSQHPLVPEDIGPAADETDSEPVAADGAVNRSGKATYLMLLATVLVGLFAILWVPDPLHSPAEQKAFPQVDIFIREMTVLETRFHSQRPELWKRSRIHLERHLRTARPTEPVSLILAAGRKAERTLHCLAQGLATAFSAAHNASVLHIDGAAAAGQDSDRVKLDIDSELQGAFGGGDRPAAVIHRLEELPPGATLIFYRYCDHENAAYKKTFLLFTVLLEQEQELGEELRLNAVEELVDDQLQRKFLSPGLSVAFDSMDRDKYSGLWSRISHLILPVATQPTVERGGC